MKKIIILLIALCPIIGFAQKKNIQKTSFEVEGVCGMCKSRIEKKAFTIKGVKSATWDIPTHQFSVIYDTSKVDLLHIHEEIAAAGTTLLWQLRQMMFMLTCQCVAYMNVK